MDRRRTLFFFSGVVLWGVLVMGLVVYLFFPYQKALKIALQNVAGNGKTTIAMEGVNMKTMGITASKVLLRPIGNTGQTAPFELSNIDITWNPLSLLRGRLTINSRALVYDGTLRANVDGIPFFGQGNPDVLLKLEHVNIGKCPEGALPWFKGISGLLDGVMKKETPFARPDRQTGWFRFNLKGGEVKDLQIKNMPRLIIPYKRIAIEGWIDGSRVDISAISLSSDAVTLKGRGTVETTDQGQNVDIKLAYEALSKAFPLKGKGTIVISGSQAAPTVTISGP
jgi:type II secretion system protein N